MRILLAVDMSESSDAVVAAVMAQFSPAGNEVRVFHAVDWERHIPLPYQFAEGASAARDVLSLRDRMLQEAGDYLARVAARLAAAGFAVTTEVAVEGDPRSQIVVAATAWSADLVVVGSHGRSGLDRLLEGSVSERVVRHAPCSVEVVRLASAATSHPIP
jgi:nucleotide-binding universal stress UspA family protein